jgi:isocitrate lyase
MRANAASAWRTKCVPKPWPTHPHGWIESFLFFDAGLNMAHVTLRDRIAKPQVLLAPGIYDALSALVAEQAGFEALYLSGASIAYTKLGRSDVGLVTASEVAQTLGHVCERVGLPVIVDADTGFGNALNTQRTVREFERAGAAMIQLEDQTVPKRCGHLSGKSLNGFYWLAWCSNLIEQIASQYCRIAIDTGF